MFKIPAQLTIAQMHECSVAFLQEVDSHDVINIDDSDVVKVDAVGIQFLLAAVTYVAAKNKELLWQSNSPVIAQSVTQLGFHEPILTQYLKN